MKKPIAFLTLTALIAIASCGAKPANEAGMMAADATSASSESVRSAPASPQKIALSYNMGVTLPEDKIDVAMRTDRANCENAGADICQVLSYGFNNSPSGVDANLQIRAVPAWLSPFRDAHAGEMQKLGGKVTSERADAENLTTQIQSTDQILRDLILNKNRLLEQINQKAFLGKDLLDAQSRLEDIQRQITEISAQAQGHKARVDMSSMSITYETKHGGIDRRALAPVKESLARFFDFFFQSLAILISLLAVILPFIAAGTLFLIAKNPIAQFYRKLNPKKISETDQIAP